MSKLLRRNLIGFIIFSFALLFITSSLELSSQVTITIIILTIIGLIFIWMTNKKK